jgi:hypothetical protein
MKKILVLFALSTVVFTVFAQDSKFIIGVEAAAIRTIPWGEDIYDAIQPNYSISPGLNLEYLLSPNLSLKSGLLYERKGWATEITRLDTNHEPIGTHDQTAHFDYLTIPLMVSYSTKGTVRFYVNGGTYFGVLLSNTITLGEFGDYPEKTIDVKEDTKTFDFGLSFGCGLFLPIGERIAFDFGLRDNLGLIDIFIPENDGKSRMNTIGIVASLKYRL